MKVYTNHPQIQQKQRIGTIASLIGVVLMFSALGITFVMPQYAYIAWLLSFIGLGIAMVGTYHVNRWVRPPLAHAVLGETLKRLDGRYLLFNHLPLEPHLLLTPHGLVAIKVKRYEGPVGYDPAKARWKGKFSIRRFYGQGLTAEFLGDPGEELTAARNRIVAWLQAELPEIAEEVPVEGVALFLSPKVTLELAEPVPVAIAQPETIKKVTQGLFAGAKPLPREIYTRLRKKLEAEATEVTEKEKGSRS